MEASNFTPFVRFCSEVYLASDYATPVKAYDFRLFYVISGGFYAVFDNETFEVSKGDILAFPPDISYRLFLKECGKSNHIIINFDFVYDNCGTVARKPDSEKEYIPGEVYSRECREPFDRIFYLSAASDFEEDIKTLCCEMRAKREDSSELISAELKSLLIRLAREHVHRAHAQKDEHDILCDRVKSYINDKYAGSIDNASIAAAFGYHPYYLNSVFKSRTGMTVHTYIVEKRLAAACELLLSTNLSVSEIGSRVGFSGASYFSECFAAHVGSTPRQYRERAK